MAASTTIIPIPKESQKSLIHYYNNTYLYSNQNLDVRRTNMEKRDRAYAREEDLTEANEDAKLAHLEGDTTKFRNITVPVVKPQVEAAVTYQSSVFLTGSPIFGVVASPEYQDDAMQLETVISNQANRGGWTRQFMMFFRDCFKYNFAPIEVDWNDEVVPNIDTDLSISTDQGIPKQTIWSGNRVRRLCPYNTIVDPRVPPTEVYLRGEYAGYTQSMSRIELKSFIEALPDKMNVTEAFESVLADNVYYTPVINQETNPELLEYDSNNWMRWARLDRDKKKIEYKDNYEVTTFYCRILPSEFGLKVPKRNIPQVYKLIIINHSVVIYAEKQTNAHNYIPILIGQAHEDGLGYQTKSLAADAEDFQSVTSAYMNSIMHSRRRAVTDRVLYDPSRISKAHINSDNPSAKIPVRPAAFGTSIAESVYAFPYREDQAGHSIQQIQSLLGLSNALAGQNQASQGQFVKGNKTLHEFESVMQNANGRDQMTSILLESQVFTPLKHILKINILQYQGAETIYSEDKQQLVNVDPTKLRQAVMEFKISDGLIPSSKLVNADTLSVAMQVLGSSPNIAQAYDLGKLFSYMMKTQGAKIQEFEKPKEQVMYEQAQMQWQQMVMELAKQGVAQDNFPPQPTPEQFGILPERPPAGISEAE